MQELLDYARKDNARRDLRSDQLAQDLIETFITAGLHATESKSLLGPVPPEMRGFEGVRPDRHRFEQPLTMP